MHYCTRRPPRSLARSLWLALVALLRQTAVNEDATASAVVRCSPAFLFALTFSGRVVGMWRMVYMPVCLSLNRHRSILPLESLSCLIKLAGAWQQTGDTQSLNGSTDFIDRDGANGSIDSMNCKSKVFTFSGAGIALCWCWC